MTWHSTELDGMTQPKISSIAYLIAEPVRAVILITLADGSSMSASALADAAGVTPQTASSHLAKLLDGGLLTVETKGRNRFYQLAGPDVSHVLESLAAVAPQTSSWRSLPNRSAHELRFARCCYDHLAGQVGVAVTRAMLARPCPGPPLPGLDRTPTPHRRAARHPPGDFLPAGLAASNRRLTCGV